MPENREEIDPRWITQQELVKSGSITRNLLLAWRENGLPVYSVKKRLYYDPLEVIDYLKTNFVRAGRMTNDESDEIGTAMREAALEQKLMQTEKMRRGQKDYIESITAEYCKEIHAQIKTAFAEQRKVLNRLTDSDKKTYIAEMGKVWARLDKSLK